jgi:alkylhydroperoxidase family enzyme
LKTEESALPWIRQIPISDATGVLKKHFDAALARAGRVWNIVHVMSVNPAALESNMRHYAVLMKEPSPLTRVQRELLATVTSAVIGCRY